MTVKCAFHSPKNIKSLLKRNGTKLMSTEGFFLIEAVNVEKILKRGHLERK
jgi:hypothetical protein